MKSLPSESRSYRQTPVFSEATVPAGLLKGHQTKPGTWAKVVVLRGELLLRILEPETEERILDAYNFGVVEPEVMHEVTPKGQVSFYIEFFKVEDR